MLEKPLGTMRRAAGRALGAPINLGLTAIGRSIGLARGTVRAVSEVVTGRRPDRPDDTDTDTVAPSPADVAARAGGPDRAATEEAEITTPVGTPAADVAHNPDTTDTDLQQPGTEPLMDPATTKAVASEAEILRKAADPDKG